MGLSVSVCVRVFVKCVLSKSLLISHRRRCPLPTKGMTLKVIIGRGCLIAGSRHLADSSDPLWLVSGTEKTCSDVDLCARQIDAKNHKYD